MPWPPLPVWKLNGVFSEVAKVFRIPSASAFSC